MENPNAKIFGTRAFIAGATLWDSLRSFVKLCSSFFESRLGMNMADEVTARIRSRRVA